MIFFVLLEEDKLSMREIDMYGIYKHLFVHQCKKNVIGLK